MWRLCTEVLERGVVLLCLLRTIQLSIVTKVIIIIRTLLSPFSLLYCFITPQVIIIGQHCVLLYVILEAGGIGYTHTYIRTMCAVFTLPVTTA